MADDKGTISTTFTPEETALLAELETKHGRISAFRVKGHGLFVVRKPLRPEWRKYLNDKKRPEIDQAVRDEQLYKALIVLPADPGALDRMLDDFPNMVEPLEQIVLALATGTGGEIKILGKDWKTPDATT